MKICKHFTECGGCSFQNIDYKEQLKIKEENIKKLMDYYEFPQDLLRPINYYNEWFYRNKMEFTFSSSEEIVCGLYKRGDNYKVVDIEECFIFSSDLPIVLKELKKFVKNNSYVSYNKFSHTGFLRNFIIRETKFSKELMIGIVATSNGDFDRDGFVKVFTSLELSSNLKSIYFIINNSLSDSITLESKELLYKDEFIFETLDRYKFAIGINSFFQVNSSGALDFYKKIKKYASLTKKDRVLDLFCGVGGIGIFLSEDIKSTIGIDINKDIISNAIENAKINNINNISFINSDVRKFLNSNNLNDIDVVVINPPRAGLSNKIKRAILRLNPRLIIYSSCNPITFFRDLKDLSFKYNIDFIEPFDFFPHTPHIEILSFLKIKVG